MRITRDTYAAMYGPRVGDKVRLADTDLIIEVDPETYEVHADGELPTCGPATELPMAQRYFLY